ncbi:MAG TPA: DoxX family membrane protein [Puia sp.]|jgi:thiosulfate dehydrogenase [quinone] large subunit|nr:DoxX family membrane protein [Puia sp.]
MNSLAYLITRLAIGFSFFGHGLVRMTKLAGFSKWMVGSFQKSMLPEGLVTAFSYILPFLEFLVGLLLLLGLFTRQALIAGAVVMLLLILGTTLIEDWDALPTQLIHVLFLVVLLQFVVSNIYSVDQLMKKPL